MSFLKVKRKHEVDPKEVFILASKKSKINNDGEIPVFELTNSSVKEEDVDNVINNTIKTGSRIKTRTFDLEKLRSKLRESNAELARERKLRVLNHIRKLEDSAEEESIHVIDLDDDSETDENGNKFVYDLYYSSTFVDFSNPESIREYQLHEIGEDDFYIKDESENENVLEEEDDSNDENYFTNDYPDESYEVDEDEDDSEDYLSHKFKNVRLDSDYSLSSDELDEDYCGFKHTNRKKDNFDYYNEVVDNSESD